MPKIDANIVLKIILNDHAELSPKAKEIIDNNIVEVPVEALCEVVFVLHGHYEANRENISAALKNFFANTRCALSHREAVLKGIAYFGASKLDFVDCILAGYMEIEYDEIYTFDEKLQKLLLKIKSSSG
jgi:predicted nucleic-acid-binding protein